MANVNVQGKVDIRSLATIHRELKKRGVEHIPTFSSLLNNSIELLLYFMKAEKFPDSEQALQYLNLHGLHTAQLLKGRDSNKTRKEIALENIASEQASLVEPEVEQALKAWAEEDACQNK